MSPHLPITLEEIAEACLGAAKSGAAAVHIHVRDVRLYRLTSTLRSRCRSTVSLFECFYNGGDGSFDPPFHNMECH
jgi:hypothetical protein